MAKQDNIIRDISKYRPGVGIMLLNSQNKVFVGQRLDNPGAWQMPQGGIDEGEDIQKALFRELEEETGTNKAELIAEAKDWFFYDLPQGAISKFWNGKYIGQRQKWFLLKFTGQDSDININTVEPEFDKWHWEDAYNLVGLIVDFKRDMYKQVLEEFKDYL